MDISTFKDFQTEVVGKIVGQSDGEVKMFRD